MAGDGGISMLFGDLMTVVEQELPIKIAVYDNGKLGFVEIEQKAEGMLDTFTKLKNPNFAGVARALGLWGETVSMRGPARSCGQGLAGATRARASARARQPDAARHAAIHAGGAGDRNGALFGSRHPARPWRRRLGNGEGEFPLVAVSLAALMAARSSSAPHASGQIARFAGAIGGAHSPLLYLRRRHACGFAVDRRLVSADAAGDVR